MDAAGRILPKMESVACVLPGLLAQGVLHGVADTERTRRNHLALARELLETCWVTYASTPTHLAAEIVRFGPDRYPPHRGRAKHAHRTPLPDPPVPVPGTTAPTSDQSALGATG